MITIVGVLHRVDRRLSPSLIFFMALDTKIFCSAEDKMIFEIRTHRGMTADTAHHLIGAGVAHLLTHRMGKFSLGFMTAGANGIPVSLQHCQFIRAMHIMALRTHPGILMPVHLGIIVGHGVHVAITADLPLSAMQHFFVIGGMGGMTTGALIFRRTG